MRGRLPGAPASQTKILVVYPNVLPLYITPSFSPRTVSTNDTTNHNCK